MEDVPDFAALDDVESVVLVVLCFVGFGRVEVEQIMWRSSEKEVVRDSFNN